MKKYLTFILFLLISKNVSAFDVELSEISFKDNQEDWIELKINSIPDKNILIKDDSLITEISSEKTQNINYILIHFKSETEKIISEDNVLHIYITKPGLTGTTEQITLETAENIIEAVCWQNDSVPESEQKDIEKLKQLNVLKGDCLDSEIIEKNQSIAKTYNNENFSWKTYRHPTPGQKNIESNAAPKAIISIQKGELKNKIPFSLNLDGRESTDPDNDSLEYKWQFPDRIVEKANPPSYRFEKSGDFEITLEVTDSFGESDTTSIKVQAIAKENNTTKKKDFKNGDLSENIKISEIFANPKGKDQGKEWIELYNTSNKKINLGNWKITAADKEHIISDEIIINGKSHFILENLKISLKNTKNTINLLDFQNKKIDRVSYPDIKEDQSFSHITIKKNNLKKSHWFATSPTKNQKNPVYLELKGIITTEPTIDKEFYFEIQNQDMQISRIIFNENDFKFELLSSLLKRNIQICTLVEKNNDNLILKKYIIQNKKISSNTKNNQKQNIIWPYFLFIPIISLTATLFSTSHYKSSAQTPPLS